MPIKKLIKTSKSFMEKVRSAVQDLQEQGIEENEKRVELPKDKTQEMLVEVSIWSATKVILVILGFLLLQNVLAQLLDIFVIFFFALFLAAAFNPGTDWLEKKMKVPRGIGVVLLYFLVLGILIVIVGGVVPVLIEQISEIAILLKKTLGNFLQGGKDDQGLISKLLPDLQNFLGDFSKAKVLEQVQQNLQTIAENLGDFASNAFGAIISVVNGIFNFVLILLLTFFMVVERDSLNGFFTKLFPKKYEKYIISRASRVQKKIGEWLHGQILLFFIVGSIAFLGLWILGVKYALTLALVAGLAEFVPYLGPMLAFATAAPVAFNQSIFLGFWVIGFYSGLQILEGNIIVPLVMKKTVGLPPIVTIFSMLIGWQFLGILGVILSVPIASILAIFVADFTGRKR